MRYRGLVIITMCLGVAAAANCSGERSTLGDLPTVHSFDVPANTPYTETGHMLAPGIQYRFHHVGGRVCYQGLDRCAPPRGSDIPDEEAWALHIKLKDELVPFVDGMILSVEEETELVFFLPEGDSEEYDEDELPLYEDNRGSFHIEVERRPAPRTSEFSPGIAIASAGADGWCAPAVTEGMKRLAEIGARQVLLPVPHLTDGRTIWPSTRTPRVLCLVRASEAARDQGLGVAWSLEVDPVDRSPRSSLDPEDRDAFFAAYEELARVFAGLAQAEGISLFSPAGGFTALTRTPEDRRRWSQLFLELHTRFFGTLFYTADRTEVGQLEAEFWKTCCDRVGIRPDFSLSDATMPPSQELAAAWEPHLEPLEELFRSTALRLVLVGAPMYPATTRCAYRPGDTIPGRVPDELCQVEAYRAWFEAFGPAAARFASDHFLGEISVVGAPSIFSPLSRLAEEILVDAWQ